MQNVDSLAAPDFAQHYVQVCKIKKMLPTVTIQGAPGMLFRDTQSHITSQGIQESSRTY